MIVVHLVMLAISSLHILTFPDLSLPLSFSPPLRYDDLVVGAPMYSQIDSKLSEVQVETGRVYVFINQRVSYRGSSPLDTEFYLLIPQSLDLFPFLPHPSLTCEGDFAHKWYCI